EVEPAGPEDAADAPAEVRFLPAAARVVALEHVEAEGDQQQQHARLHARQDGADRDDGVHEVADVADRLQLLWIRHLDDVVHVPSASLDVILRAANSSSPDWPSRRSSSARTSAGVRPWPASAIRDRKSTRLN